MRNLHVTQRGVAHANDISAQQITGDHRRWTRTCVVARRHHVAHVPLHRGCYITHVRHGHHVRGACDQPRPGSLRHGAGQKPATSGRWGARHHQVPTAWRCGACHRAAQRRGARHPLSPCRGSRRQSAGSAVTGRRNHRRRGQSGAAKRPNYLPCSRCRRVSHAPCQVCQTHRQYAGSPQRSERMRWGHE